MQLKEHIFVSSYFLAICSILWGTVEIITIFSTIDLENISFVAYLSILVFPLLLYGITGLVAGLFPALLYYLVIARRSKGISIHRGTTIYILLYFIPLLIGVEYLWNRRYLPGISITDLTSLVHSLIVAISVFLVITISKGLLNQIFRERFPLARSLVIVLVTGGIVALYLGINSLSDEAPMVDAPPPTTDKPNILLITIDTLRADHLGCYGNASIHTPTIDSLAAGGIKFQRATSQVPLTLPSHTSILTSTYPPIHGVRDNARYSFGNSIPTLAEVLKESGYLTSAFISAFVLDSRFGLDEGFDVYDDNIQNQAYFYFFSASPPFALAGGLKLLGLSPPYKPERKADQTTGAVIEWIEKNRESRFFMWVHYFDPHGPLNPPAPYDTLYLSPGTDPHRFRDDIEDLISLLGKVDSRELSDEEIEGIKSLYKGEVTFTDHHIGNLMKSIRELGIGDRTLVVLTSDHGQSLSEHHYIGHSMELYQEIMHIPLIINYPGQLQQGLVVEELVQSIDIMPTILSSLEIEVPVSCSGSNLLRLVEPSARNRDDSNQWAYIETLFPKPARNKLVGLSSEDYKYIRALEGEREELYHVKTDPKEMDNLASADTQRSEQMRNHILSLLEEWQNESTSIEIPLDHQTTEAMKALGYIQ
jgi:arylsulfatase A-like enzyme